MTYGQNLERRGFGVFYYRQTVTVAGVQHSKRFSLKTKNPEIAKFLALQIKARTEMMDPKNIKKYTVTYDGQNNIASVSVTDDTDSKNLHEFLKLREIHRAEEHKRQLELLKMEQDIQKQQAYINSVQGQANAKLHAELTKLILKPELSEDGGGTNLATLKESYLDSLTVTEGTKYKYKNYLEKFLLYAQAMKVSQVSQVNRKFVYQYLLHLQKVEKKTDNTIQNTFNVFSTFYNHLVMTGEANLPNPFVGHKLDVVKTKRPPFTDPEIRKIFQSPKLLGDKKLFFICLLLLTTGARPNEICQLWVDDIYKEDGIYKLRITENEVRGQTLKTKSSDRVIYLHQLLIDNGFLDYIEGSQGFVFDLKKPASKTYSTFISMDFTKVIRQLSIDKEKTMYCFRHTVINRLKQKNVELTIREDLVGHEGQGTNEQVYAQNHSAVNLKKATEKILMYSELKIFT